MRPLRAAGLSLWVSVTLCVLGVGTGLAQTADEVAQHRREIAAQKSAIEQAYVRDRADCYQRFAVNDCLIALRRQRGEQLGELRRQEVVLNDLERQRKSSAQVLKLDERQTESAVQRSNEQRLERADAAEQKRQTHETRVPPQPQPVKTPNQPSTGRGPTSSAAGQAYQQKQNEALQRQKDAQTAREKRTKPLAAPLPADGLPPTPLQSELTSTP